MKRIIYGDQTADICLFQMVDDHDMEFLQKEYELIAAGCKAVKPLLVAVHVDDWNKDLSPWRADAVFGNEPFGNGAEDTLTCLTEDLLPEIREQYFTDKTDVKYIIGGYSLAGLFALWTAYQTDLFSACVAASPSVWFPGWLEYAESRNIMTDNIYLSLGRKEPKTRNPVMQTVGDCMIRQDELLSGRNHIFEWNEGNHFQDAGIRTAKGFLWAIAALIFPRSSGTASFPTDPRCAAFLPAFPPAFPFSPPHSPDDKTDY